MSADDALRRFEPMNSIGWTVGHLAWQEQRYWLTMSQGQTPVPELNTLVGYRRPATTPPLADMLTAWRTITGASDAYLDR
ncbi:MAG: DinB family protein [Caldilineaceae bacterium]